MTVNDQGLLGGITEMPELIISEKILECIGDGNKISIKHERSVYAGSSKILWYFN